MFLSQWCVLRLHTPCATLQAAGQGSGTILFIRILNAYYLVNLPAMYQVRIVARQ